MTSPLPSSSPSGPADHSTVIDLATQISSKLMIQSQDWHRLKSNRKARALEHCAAALVFLLKDQPQEALLRLQQAVGWLDRSLSAPPCPTHGAKPQAPRINK